jgi:hypothetical protein
LMKGMEAQRQKAVKETPAKETYLG